MIDTEFIGRGVLSLGVSPFGGWPLGVGQTIHGVNSVVNLGRNSTIPLGHAGPTLNQPDGRHVVAVEGQGIFQYDSLGRFIRRFVGGHLGDVPSDRGSRVRDFVLAPDGDVIISGDVGLNLNSPGQEQFDFNGIDVFSADGLHKLSIAGPADNRVAGAGGGRVLCASELALVRYSLGQLDQSFGPGGVVALPPHAGEQDLQVDSLGRIYVSWTPSSDGSSTIMRFTADGRLDTTYGDGGTLSTDVLGLNGDSREHVLVAPDGRVYVSALVEIGNGADDGLVVGRLNVDGTKDTTWGASGIVSVDFDGGDHEGGELRDMLVLPDSDLLVAAAINDGNDGDDGVDDTVRSHIVRLRGTPLPSDETRIILADAVITVTATSGNDVITLRTLPDGRLRINANDQVATLSKTHFSLISVSGGDGADYIEARDLKVLPNAGGIPFEITLSGGGGNDIIVGSQGPDRITGDDGDDRLHGWDGEDWVSGNAQKDRVIGGAGNDLLNGNGGRDGLAGEDGNDVLNGGDQPDKLFGGAGDDSLDGGGGHDWHEGGAGADFLYGAGGDDTFLARDGEIDEIIGGMAGLDRAQTDDDDTLAGIEQLLA